MTTIAFCDPGLDRVSIAVFTFELVPGRQVWRWASYHEKIRRLIVVEAVKTSPKESLPDRLLAIGRGTHAILKATSAAPVGPSLRAACEAAEVAIAAAIQSDASRSQTRKAVRVNVMRSEVVEEP